MNKVVVIATLVLLATIGVSAYAYTAYMPSFGAGLGGPGSGALSIYLTDSPHSNATLKYLLVNVTSVTLMYESGSETSSTTTSSTTSSASTTSTTSSVSTSSSTSSTSSVSTSSTSSATTASSSVSTAVSATSTQAPSEFVYSVPPSVGTNVNLTKLQGNALLLGATKAPAGNVTEVVLNISGARAFWTNGPPTQLKVVADGKLMVHIHFQILSNGTTNLTVDITPGGIHVSPGNDRVLRPVVLVHVTGSGPGNSTQTSTTETSVTESDTTTS